jgi:hypothetical protein
MLLRKPCQAIQWWRGHEKGLLVMPTPFQNPWRFQPRPAGLKNTSESLFFFYAVLTLYIEHILQTAVMRHVGWVFCLRLYWKRRLHSRLHIYPLCGIFCLPWYLDTQVQGISVLHVMYISFKGWGYWCKVTCPMSQATRSCRPLHLRSISDIFHQYPDPRDHSWPFVIITQLFILQFLQRDNAKCHSHKIHSVIHDRTKLAAD